MSNLLSSELVASQRYIQGVLKGGSIEINSDIARCDLSRTELALQRYPTPHATFYRLKLLPFPPDPANSKDLDDASQILLALAMQIAEGSPRLRHLNEKQQSLLEKWINFFLADVILASDDTRTTPTNGTVFQNAIESVCTIVKCTVMPPNPDLEPLITQVVYLLMHMGHSECNTSLLAWNALFTSSPYSVIVPNNANHSHLYPPDAKLGRMFIVHLKRAIHRIRTANCNDFQCFCILLDLLEISPERYQHANILNLEDNASFAVQASGDLAKALLLCTPRCLQTDPSDHEAWTYAPRAARRTLSFTLKHLRRPPETCYVLERGGLVASILHADWRYHYLDVQGQSGVKEIGSLSIRLIKRVALLLSVPSVLRQFCRSSLHQVTLNEARFNQMGVGALSTAWKNTLEKFTWLRGVYLRAKQEASFCCYAKVSVRRLKTLGPELTITLALFSVHSVIQSPRSQSNFPVGSTCDVWGASR
ncbi:hypothetical protein V5O48_009136 [Marasmius crinis-equi]|uniref:Uncharacterized protein n=1 Tax=Marasmius crinis-equi TaxID=585013 RepID=A0ABR3FBX0_9AGAR